MNRSVQASLLGWYVILMVLGPLSASSVLRKCGGVGLIDCSPAWSCHSYSCVPSGRIADFQVWPSCPKGIVEITEYENVTIIETPPPTTPRRTTTTSIDTNSTSVNVTESYPEPEPEPQNITRIEVVERKKNITFVSVCPDTELLICIREELAPGNYSGRCSETFARQIQCGRDYHCDWDQKCIEQKCERITTGEVRARPYCLINEECWYGHYCLNGRCQKQAHFEPSRCTDWRQCTTGKVCWNNMCVTRSSIRNNIIKTDRCLTNNECSDYRACDQGLCIGINFRMTLCFQNDFQSTCDELPTHTCSHNHNSGRAQKRHSVCSHTQEKKRPCKVDTDCELGDVCHQIDNDRLECHNFLSIYQSNQCSWDGHCYVGNCIRFPGERASSCRVLANRPERDACKTKEDCEEYHFCSFGRCTYPQRHMHQGEALPCYSSDECPNGLICYRNGCVRRNQIPRGYCSDDEQCSYSRLVNNVCFDGWCVSIDLIPWTRVEIANNAYGEYNSNFSLSNPTPSSLGVMAFPDENVDCRDDLHCPHGELCMNIRDNLRKICRRPEWDTCKEFERPCQSEAYVCHHGYCIAILNVWVEFPPPPLIHYNPVEIIPENDKRPRKYVECLSDLSCRPSEKCQGQKCIRGREKRKCETDFDCQARSACIFGHCHEDPN